MSQPPASDPSAAPEEPPALHRRAMLVGSAFAPSLKRATWVGSIVAAVVAIAVALALGDAPAILVATIAAIVGAAAGTLAAALSLPPRTRHALEAFAWLGRREMDRFQARTGQRVPTTPPLMAAMLAALPATPQTAQPRVELFAVLGRFDEARAALDSVPPPADDLEAVELAVQRRFVRQLDTGVIDNEELDALEPRLVPGSPAARELLVARGLAEARRRRESKAQDWREPLADARTALDREATMTVVRDIWRKLAISLLLVSWFAGLVMSMSRG